MLGGPTQAAGSSPVLQVVSHAAGHLQQVLERECVLVLHGAGRVQVREVAHGVDEDVTQAGHLDLREASRGEVGDCAEPGRL